MMATAPIRFEFDQQTHTYTVNGQKVPSVSEVLRSAGLVDYDGIPPEVLAYAAKRGSLVHAACQYWDEDDLDIDSLDRQLVAYVVAWRNFRQDHPFEILESEAMHLGELGGLRYGMTLDRLVQLDGKRTLLDIKTSREIMPWHPVQTAGYACGLESSGNALKRLSCVSRAIVQLKPDCTYRLHECADPQDGEVFAAALRIAHWKLDQV